jgi:hypothetical protein
MKLGMRTYKNLVPQKKNTNISKESTKSKINAKTAGTVLTDTAGRFLLMILNW